MASAPTHCRLHTLLIVLSLGMAIGWFLLAYALLVIVHRVSPLH